MGKITEELIEVATANAISRGGELPLRVLSFKCYKEIERIIQEGWEYKIIYSDVDAWFYIKEWDSRNK